VIDTEKSREKFAELIKKGELTTEFIFSKQDGTKFHVEIKAVKLNDNRYIGFTQDISQRKEVEKKIRKERDKLKKYFETTQAIVVNLDKNRRVREINQTACDILGYKKEEIIGEDWFDNFVKEEEQSRVEEVFAEIIEERKLIDCENTILTKSGAERDVFWHNNLLTNQSGEVTGSLSTGIDITEMKWLKEELETSKLQIQFFANLSHELKTPLNLIFSAQQMLKIEEKKLPEENQARITRYLDIIYQNGNRLLRLVNNMLDINKFETDAFELTLGNYDLVEIVENISSSVREHIEQKEREFQFFSQVDEIILACDPFNLERVLLNLLSNAIKFTEAGDKITLEVEELKDKARIIVSDTGRGIPEDKQQMIFERFGQADKSFNRSNEGTGIGLSIVQLILQAHGGKIRLNSEYGAGAEFIIELPSKELTEKNQSFSASRYSSQQLIDQINMEFSDIYQN
jgi:PAS domain S-box-containing protein